MNHTRTHAHTHTTTTVTHPLPRQMCFRLGLFGLDKLADVSACVHTFEKALDAILAAQKSKL